MAGAGAGVQVHSYSQVQVVRRQTVDGEEHMVHMNGKGDAWLVTKEVAMS